MRRVGVIALAAVLVGLGAWLSIRALRGTPAAGTSSDSAAPAAAAEATSEQVHSVCATCHAYPPPESFPRSAWRKEVKQGFEFLREDFADVHD